MTLAGTAGWAFADTVVLKSGEKVDGKIVSESDTGVDIEVQVSATIKDTRSIAKEEIESVQKASDDDLAFAELKGFKIDPESSVPVAAYDRMLGALQDFLMRYPDTSHATEVRAVIAQLQGERDRVVGGEVKVFGKWLTKAEVERNRFDIEAQQNFAVMRQSSMRGDVAGALNAFDTVEKQYGGSRIYPDAVELALQILRPLKVDVERRPAALAKQKADLDKAIAMASEPRKSQIVAAATQEVKRYADAMAAGAKSALRWKPYIPNYAPSVESYRGQVGSELTRLSALPVEAMRSSVQLTDEAEAAIERKEGVRAGELLNQARAKWAANKAVERLTKRMQDEKISSSPTPTPTPATAASSDAGDSETAATSGSARAAAAAAAAKSKDEEKPFYMTLPGAAAIAGGVLVLITIMSIISKAAAKKREENAKS